ncbi:MAG TPA: hypothetical protein VG412_10005 [Acidimicrobiales bacterium]|nr:hypothetical protein [Acidimicrobiales bacterium]
MALSTTAIGVVALAAAILAAASDTGMAGFRLPVHHRQVNERWLDHFRPWVYAAGFGWQIGTGLATYITTAAVYLMILLGALGGSPVRAVALGVGFGFVRGLSVLLGRNITTPDGLRAFHRRFVDTGPKVGRIVVACEAAAALAVAWFLSPLLGLGVTAVVAVAGVVGVRRSAAATAAEAAAAAAAASGTCTPLPGSGSGPGSSAGSSAGAGDPEAATAEPSAGVARSQRLRAGSAT